MLNLRKANIQPPTPVAQPKTGNSNQVVEEAITFIKPFEGYRPRIYRCASGYPTVGYGHVITAKEKYLKGVYVTRPKAEALLRKDILHYYGYLRLTLATPLAVNQWVALVSLTYNIGTTAFFRSTMRQVLNRGDLFSAAEQFERWIWGGGRKLPGLVKRRLSERYLFEHGFTKTPRFQTPLTL